MFRQSETLSGAVVYTAISSERTQRLGRLMRSLEGLAFAALTVLMVSIILGTEFLDWCRGLTSPDDDPSGEA